ncbi:TfoX/Sxy family protein [Fulvivirga ligni]|uniref:TfoX/Sxy family protein n=1 Tax=Fulvivirga ligni TaxID=2904246 RepID=UPI001F350CE0|nr:TfoX/Sxy family protein [Fulvivirga ligni]UII19165.1 TfoX/Sxy family protein [Fulvivirga ligni]
MAYDEKLAQRVRHYLRENDIQPQEKKMFGGLAFMISDKMCVNVSKNNLMCRFDPVQTQELAVKKGFSPMIMKGREYKGYCYVEPEGFASDGDFKFWVDLCLEYNKTL